MGMQTQGNYRLRVLILGVTAALLLLGLTTTARGVEEEKPHEQKILYVWAGDADRKDPDFVAVVNFDQRSPDYGKVIRTVPVPTAGNEPHHCELVDHDDVLACGGLLSVLRGQDEIFFFDVSDDPANPRFIGSADPPLSSVTDEFVPLPNGHFLITQMGSATGGAPGRIAEFDEHLKLVAEWPADPPAAFNPHGISIRPELNLMVTSDFLNPVTTVDGVDGVELRHTVRVWDLANRRIVRTIDIPGAIGTMDVKLIPGDPRGRAYTSGMFDGRLYLVAPFQGTAKPVFDYPQGSMPQVMEMTSDGTRMFVSLRNTGQVVMYDISNPKRPHVLSVMDLGQPPPRAPGRADPVPSGPHVIHLTHDEKRLIVTDYFLDEDNFGEIHFDGDHKVHVLKVTRNNLVLDPRFDLDFDTAVPTGPARPHGVAFK
jgi:selenium-binding protein 1